MWQFTAADTSNPVPNAVNHFAGPFRTQSEHNRWRYIGEKVHEHSILPTNGLKFCSLYRFFFVHIAGQMKPSREFRLERFWNRHLT